MKTIRLTGIDRPAPDVVLGLMRIQDLDDDAVRTLVRTARDAGIDFFDHADVYGRDMTHALEACVVQGDHAAYCESCLYPDGVRVLSESMLTLRDGKITGQVLIQAWDE